MKLIGFGKVVRRFSPNQNKLAGGTSPERSDSFLERGTVDFQIILKEKKNNPNPTTTPPIMIQIFPTATRRFAFRPSPPPFENYDPEIEIVSAPAPGGPYVYEIPDSEMESELVEIHAYVQSGNSQEWTPALPPLPTPEPPTPIPVSDTFRQVPPSPPCPDGALEIMEGEGTPIPWIPQSESLLPLFYSIMSIPD